MANVEQIKQEIQDWYHGDLDGTERFEEPFVTAFTSFVGMLSWRRSEITLPSGIAKMWGYEETRVVFWVGEDLFATEKDPDRIEDGVTYIADWQADDLYEVKPVNKVVTELQKKDSSSGV